VSQVTSISIQKAEQKGLCNWLVAVSRETVIDKKSKREAQRVVVGT
jgi:hypothetical protein